MDGADKSSSNGTNRKARLAVAGLGRMGAVHARNLALRCPSAQLVGVFDPRREVASGLALELGTSAAASYQDLVADEALDGVVIATPTQAHAELVLEAAGAGKHVFCEKPLSLERDVTVQMVKAVHAAGVKLQVGFHRRFDPSYSAVSERVRAGDLGDVYLFRASQRDMAPPRPEFLAGSGGIFIDMGIHDFDAARWLVGEVASVSAHGALLSGPGCPVADDFGTGDFGTGDLGAGDFGTSDLGTGDFGTAVVVLTFASGALGVLDISRVAGYGYESSAELMGSRATARVDEPHLHGYEWRTPGASSRPLVATFDRRFAAAFVAELEQFARCIVDGTPPIVTGADALAAFDLASAAERACRLGEPVRLAAVHQSDGLAPPAPVALTGGGGR